MNGAKILIDGLNLKDIKLSSFRRKTAIATQQPLLFSMSIKDNITYGLKKISQDKIEESAKICCVDEYISQLPDKYNTLIGEDACKLSQGLKQRVALARAIVREPDLLILDEATSSVDSFTEEKIFKSLREKRRGLSTIVISHRLFSIKDADRIYFLQEGGIIEQGAYTELLSRSGLYKEFFLNQFTEDQNVLTV